MTYVMLRFTNLWPISGDAAFQINNR